MSIYYQFLSNASAISDLERKMIKVSRIKKVNDLFELQPYLRFDKSKRKDVRRLRDKIADKYGMVCFSSDWQEPIMWGHYADINKGVAIGFKMHTNTYVPEKVDYPTKPKRQVLKDPQNMSCDKFIKSVGFIKYANWSYEKECRFFVKLKNCRNIEDNYFLDFGNDIVVDKVILGPMNPYKSKTNYRENARYFIEIVKKHKSKIIVSRAEFGGYRVVRCGTWTPIFEKYMNNLP